MLTKLNHVKNKMNLDAINEYIVLILILFRYKNAKILFVVYPLEIIDIVESSGLIF